METHELGVHQDVNESNRVEEFLAQRNELIKAVLAAVITFRAYVEMGSWTVGGRVGGAGGGPAIVAASQVVGARVIGPCPPIMRGVVAMINAVGSGICNSGLKIHFGRLPSCLEGQSKVHLSCVPFFKDAGPI